MKKVTNLDEKKPRKWSKKPPIFFSSCRYICFRKEKSILRSLCKWTLQN